MDVKRQSLPTLGRGDYDHIICARNKGFSMLHTEQDCSYYGTWINPFSLTVVSFTEGDEVWTKCDTALEFNQEIKRIFDWNKEQGWTVAGIHCDGEDQTWFNLMGTMGLSQYLVKRKAT